MGKDKELSAAVDEAIKEEKELEAAIREAEKEGNWAEAEKLRKKLHDHKLNMPTMGW